MFGSTLGRVTVVMVLAMAFGGAVAVFALLSVVEEPVQPPQYLLTVPTPTIPVTAASWLVFDVRDGYELVGHNVDEIRSIASVSKLFSATEFYKVGDMYSTTSITQSDVATEGRAGNLKTQEIYTRRELLFPLLLESSNDAAAAMERVDPGLVSRVNSTAAKLALSHTTFVDASGLSSGNQSTAAELAVWARYVYLYEPQIYDITRLSSFYSSNNGWHNNDPFVGQVGYLGGKHGWTPEAGKTFVGVFSETLQNGATREIGYVVLGSDDLEDDVMMLRTFIRQSTRYE